MPGLLESILKKLPLSEFLLPLLLDIGKTEKHLNGIGAPDPDSFRLIVLGHSGVPTPESEHETALSGEDFFRVLNTEMVHKVLPVLPVDALVGEVLDRIDIAGREYASVFCSDLLPDPVNIIGILLQIHDEHQLVILREAPDQLQAPLVLGLDLLPLRHVAQDDGAHNVIVQVILGERDALPDPDPVPEAVLDKILDLGIFLSHPVHGQQALSFVELPELFAVVRKDSGFPAGRALSDRSRDLSLFDMFKEIVVPDVCGQHHITGHIEFEDCDGVVPQGSAEGLLPCVALLLHGSKHIQFFRVPFFAALLRRISCPLFPDAGDHLYRYAVPLFDQPVVHLHPPAVFQGIGQRKITLFRQDSPDILYAGSRHAPF